MFCKHVGRTGCPVDQPAIQMNVRTMLTEPSGPMRNPLTIIVPFPAWIPGRLYVVDAVVSQLLPKKSYVSTGYCSCGEFYKTMYEVHCKRLSIIADMRHCTGQASIIRYTCDLQLMGGANLGRAVRLNNLAHKNRVCDISQTVRTV